MSQTPMCGVVWFVMILAHYDPNGGSDGGRHREAAIDNCNGPVLRLRGRFHRTRSNRQCR